MINDNDTDSSGRRVRATTRVRTVGMVRIVTPAPSQPENVTERITTVVGGNSRERVRPNGRPREALDTSSRVKNKFLRGGWRN